MLIHPKVLRAGDTIGLIAPASPPLRPSYVDRVIAGIEHRGFQVSCGRFLRRRQGFLAGTDKERASDLMAMFENPRVRAIFCLRGGYGCGRIVSMLDYKKIARSRKIFLGFSDVTTLHLAILKASRLITFHGPVGTYFMRKMPPFTWSSLERCLMHMTSSGSVFEGLGSTDTKLEVIRKGEARGRILGGNLSVIAASLGTPYLPSFNGKILLIEEVDERPYSVDRLLTQLLNAGLLQKLSGIVLGAFTSCEDPVGIKSREYRQSVSDVLYERLYPLGIPVLKGLPVGHQALNACIPLGARVTLYAGQKSDLIINEAAVSS